MAAARERRISLYAYNTRADAEANTNGTEYTSGIVDDTPRYEHVFFTEFPGWGETNAAMFSCDISGTADLSGKWVRVKYSYYATDAATTMTDMWLFLGRVDSCRYDTLKTVRTLVAYDLLYWLRSVDVSEFWTNFWAPAGITRNIQQFLGIMCVQYSVTQGNLASMLANAPTINLAGAKATTLSGCSFVDMLAFMGQLCGVCFFIGGDGKLNCARTSNAETAAPVDALIDTQNTEIGDGALPAYTAMMAYSGADVIYSTGSGEPLYTIRDNPLLNGKTTAEITTQLNALFTSLATVAGFWPGEFEYIVSSPEEFGIVATPAVTYTKNLSTQDGNATRLHTAAAVECWGVQLINQRVTCPTAMTTGGAVSASMSAALNAIQQMAVEMTFKVNSDNVIEAVNLEAQGGVTINAQAININGVVSANGNFKVDTDGNMEAANGKFTGQITATSGAIGNVEIDGAKLVAQQSGSTYGDALFIAETDTEKAYFGAGLVRIEAPPDFAGVGTVSILTKESLTSENRISGNGYTSAFALRRMDNRGGASLSLLETNKTSAGTERSSVDVQTQGLAPSITMRHIPAGQTLADKQVTISPSGFEAVDSGTPTKITKTELIAGGKDILRTHMSLVGGWGTAIPANTDLNTDLSLWRVGRFFVAALDTVGTLTNCPTSQAFNMACENVQGVGLNGQSYQYMRRTIKDLVGDTYIQTAVWTSASALTNVSEWAKLVYDKPSTYARTDILAPTDTSLSLVTSFGGNWYRKTGNVVELNLSVAGAVASWKTVTTLPVEYRPPYDRYFSALTLAFGVGAVYVSSAGNVLVRTASGTGTVGGCITYVI